MKKSWKDWAIEFIKTTGKCPGGSPSFGLPTALCTEDEFKLGVASSGTHKYADCHWVGELLGYSVGSDMKEVPVKSPVITEEDLKRATLDEDQVVLGKLKADLIKYVNGISFKSPGVLYLPQPLLYIEALVKKYFDVTKE